MTKNDEIRNFVYNASFDDEHSSVPVGQYWPDLVLEPGIVDTGVIVVRFFLVCGWRHSAKVVVAIALAPEVHPRGIHHQRSVEARSTRRVEIEHISAKIKEPTYDS